MIDNAQGRNSEPVVETDLYFAGVIARVIVGKETLGALRAPAHRPPETPRRVKHQPVFHARGHPAAERAADIADLDP